MESLGITFPTREDQAADFITKVNAHYAPAATKIDDACRMLGHYPKTTFEAFKLLTELTAEKAFTGISNTTFTTTRTQVDSGKPYAQSNQGNRIVNASNDQNNSRRFE